MVHKSSADGFRDALPLTEDEVVGYARKSSLEKGAAKSLPDQKDTIAETAVEFDLPLDPSNILAEKAGHGGDEFWEGGGASGIEGYTEAKEKTRPVLTDIIKGVVEGRIRCIIVWSQCRLWRDVAICEAMIKLLARHKCLLYDRNGAVDISTPEGRQNVRSNAIASQHMREMSAVNSERGLKKSRKKGKNVVSGNRLGFRSEGEGVIRHLPDEQEKVREIFGWFDAGMSVDQISLKLTTEGFQWLTDVNRYLRPPGTPTPRVHRQTIRNLLTDCRFQGRQRYRGEETPCPVYLLPNGDPVVPTALYERVQARIRSNKKGAPSHSKSHPLIGLMRCGLCGQSLRSHRSQQRLKSGKVLYWHTWKTIHYVIESWCKDELPVIYVADVDAYVNNTLAPLLLAELRDRMCADGIMALADEKAALDRDLKKAEHRLNEELPEEWEEGTIDKEMLANMGRKVRDRIGDLKRRIYVIDAQLRDNERIAASITDLSSMDEAMRKVALRAVLRWVAVIPSDKPRQRRVEAGYKYQSDPDAGRVVFLTSWGTLHTAFIERQKTDNHRTRLCFLRPATPEECIVTVNDMPDPVTYFAGLERAHKNGKYDFSLREFAPGYDPDRKPPVAEFEV